MGHQYDKECWCGNDYGKQGEAEDCSCDGENIGAWKQCVYSLPPNPYMGCFKDCDGRDLPVFKGIGDKNSCMVACSGYKFMGHQYYRECWCGNDYGKQGEATGCLCDGENIGACKQCVYSVDAAVDTSNEAATKESVVKESAAKESSEKAYTAFLTESTAKESSAKESSAKESNLKESAEKEIAGKGWNPSSLEYVLVYNGRVLSLHYDLEEARLALWTCLGNNMQDWSDHRMICEVKNGKVKPDPRYLGASYEDPSTGQGGGKRAGWNKWWLDWSDIAVMNQVAQDFIDQRAAKESDTKV